MTTGDDDLIVRPMGEPDLAEADRIFRIAFGGQAMTGNLPASPLRA